MNLPLWPLNMIFMLISHVYLFTNANEISLQVTKGNRNTIEGGQNFSAWTSRGGIFPARWRREVRFQCTGIREFLHPLDLVAVNNEHSLNGHYLTVHVGICHKLLESSLNFSERWTNSRLAVVWKRLCLWGSCSGIGARRIFYPAKRQFAGDCLQTAVRWLFYYTMKWSSVGDRQTAVYWIGMRQAFRGRPLWSEGRRNFSVKIFFPRNCFRENIFIFKEASQKIFFFKEVSQKNFPRRVPSKKCCPPESGHNNVFLSP